MASEHFDKLWALYQANIASGKQPSLRNLGIPVGKDDQFGLVAPLQAEQQQYVLVVLLALWKTLVSQSTPRKGEAVDSDTDDAKKIIQLGLEFLDAAEQGQGGRFTELFNAGVPVNFQHPRHLGTALHITCTMRGQAHRQITETLLSHPQIDLLIPDRAGRLACDKAEIWNTMDEDLIERVRDMTFAKADEEIGLEQFHQQQRDKLQQWMDEDWYHAVSRLHHYL